MHKILFSPLEAIYEAKNKKSLGYTYLVLLVASLLAGLTSIVRLEALSAATIIIGFTTFISAFLIIMLMAFLLKVSLHILIQKQGFFESLTVLSYSAFIVAVGYFISAIILLVPSTNISLAIISAVLSSLVLLITTVLSIVVMLRIAQELYEKDLFTVIVALIIVNLAAILSVSSSIQTFLP